MDNFNGIGANFVGRKNLYGVKKFGNEQAQKTTEKIQQNEIENTMQRKNPEDILNSMHYFGVQNIATPKIAKIRQDAQMNSRIADFMESFEAEVEKGLKVLAKEFPGVDEVQAREIAAKSVLRASEG